MTAQDRVLSMSGGARWNTKSPCFLYLGLRIVSFFRTCLMDRAAGRAEKGKNWKAMLRALKHRIYGGLAVVYPPFTEWKMRQRERRRRAKEARRPNRYTRLLEIIRTEKCKKIMEIGTWNGRQAERMIGEAAKHHGAGEVEYYGFDLFDLQDDDMFEKELAKRARPMAEVEERLEKTGARIRLFKGNTISTLPEIVPSLPKMDLIYIDGGHSLETIESDWRNVKKLMHERMVVVFDDYWEGRDDAGCKAIVEAIDKQEYDVKVLDHCDSFENGALRIHFVEVRKRLHAGA